MQSPSPEELLPPSLGSPVSGPLALVRTVWFGLAFIQPALTVWPGWRLLLRMSGSRGSCRGTAASGRLEAAAGCAKAGQFDRLRLLLCS